MDVDAGFAVIECPSCNGVAAEVAFKGRARVKCPTCGTRLLIAANGDLTRVLLADRPKARLR